jgi:hypothetical protein
MIWQIKGWVVEVVWPSRKRMFLLPLGAWDEPRAFSMLRKGKGIFKKLAAHDNNKKQINYCYYYF